jgi:hypothetical protein
MKFNPFRKRKVDLTTKRQNTAAPGDPIAAPGDPTAAPGDPTAAPGDPTAAPGDPTAAPGDPTAAPGDPIAAPGDPIAAPGISAEKKLLEKKLLNAGRWFFFSLIIASTPIILALFSLSLHNIPITIDNTLAHGELLLVSIAILGEITGDLVFNQTVGLRFRLIVTGFNLFFLILSIFFFADIVRTLSVAQILLPYKNMQGIDKAYYVNKDLFAAYCFFIFAYTFLMGLSCKVMVID